MRKYLLIILLASSVQGADILENFKNYRHLIRQAFDVDTVDTDFMDDSTLNQFVRISVITLTAPLQSNKKIFTDTTVFRQKQYALDSTIVTIYDVFWEKQDTIRPLAYMKVGNWSKGIGDLKKFLADEGQSLEKRPYFYDFTDDEILLYPTPINGGDTIKIMALRKVPSLSAVDSLATVPQNYRAPIYHYACWLVARAKQHPLKEDYRLGYTEAIAFLRASEGRAVEVTP